ncbi:hypothetical protein [Paenibacillus elgii]|uniref:hypothetical protein n=1 Tax=Paenibacillus elgii TaxID=189691 RepID=UPI00203F811A|nr:hypothetical protein [Paenibacillus elgii]MCM3274213.1 hypothetical protein [Paenibacillus elgii]
MKKKTSLRQRKEITWVENNLFETMRSKAEEFEKISEEDKESNILAKVFARGIKITFIIIAIVLCVLLLLYLVFGGWIVLILNAIFNQLTSDEKRVQEELAYYLKNNYREELMIDKVDYNGTLDEYNVKVHSIANPQLKIRVSVVEKGKQFIFKDDYVQELWETEFKKNLYPKLKEVVLKGEYQLIELFNRPDHLNNELIYDPKHYTSFQDAINNHVINPYIIYQSSDRDLIENNKDEVLEDVFKVVRLLESYGIKKARVEIVNEMSCEFKDITTIGRVTDLENICTLSIK